MAKLAAASAECAAVAVADQPRDEIEIYCRRQSAEQMGGGDQVFIDHTKETVLAGVLALHSRSTVASE